MISTLLPASGNTKDMTALLQSLRLLHALAFLLRLSTAGATSRAPEPPEQPAGCSPSPKACGGLNVSYPFWLEEPGRPPCGSLPFQLKCNASGAFLSHSVFQAYRVVAIFARNSSVHVVDENLPFAAGCPAPCPCFNISLGVGRQQSQRRAALPLPVRQACPGGSARVPAHALR